MLLQKQITDEKAYKNKLYEMIKTKTNDFTKKSVEHFNRSANKSKDNMKTIRQK